MSRALIGHERTRARRAVAALSAYNPAVVARLLGLKKHVVAPILDGRARPQRCFYEAVARLNLTP